jgi:hypothetical protein
LHRIPNTGQFLGLAHPRLFWGSSSSTSPTGDVAGDIKVASVRRLRRRGLFSKCSPNRSPQSIYPHSSALYERQSKPTRETVTPTQFVRLEASSVSLRHPASITQYRCRFDSRTATAIRMTTEFVTPTASGRTRVRKIQGSSRLGLMTELDRTRLSGMKGACKVS